MEVIVRFWEVWVRMYGKGFGRYKQPRVVDPEPSECTPSTEQVKVVRPTGEEFRPTIEK